MMKNLDKFKKDYFDSNKELPKSRFYDNSHRTLKNQSPYDLIANYSEKEQQMLINWCKENFTPIKKRKLCTYHLKHWAEHCLTQYGLSYVSTGAIKGALLLSGFDLDPDEFNAYVNIGSAYSIEKKVHLKYGVGIYVNDHCPKANKGYRSVSTKNYAGVISKEDLEKSIKDEKQD
ncbi:hypothetical protein [Lactobacillus helveticus]|uniref:hypothetical protein n=1 Tax=Lactobacillus helveticus TaxID=1587 RepID=UPI001564B8F2|nr:hypothetical protein [Lactobacillus helveticus]